MQSLSDLNTYAQTQLPVTDLRAPRITFTLPLSPIIQTWVPGAKTSGIISTALEIANPSLADVEFSVELFSSPATAPGTFVIDFGTVPSGVTVTQTGNWYVLSGFTSADQWNQVKSYAFTVPADISTVETWFLRNEVSYYDTTIAGRRTASFDIFDPQYYPVADMASAFSVWALTTNLKELAVLMESAFAVEYDAVVAPSFDVNAAVDAEFVTTLTRRRGVNSGLTAISSLWAYVSDFEVMPVTASLAATPALLRSTAVQAPVTASVALASQMTASLAMNATPAFGLAADAFNGVNYVDPPFTPFTFTEDTNKSMATMLTSSGVNILPWEPDQVFTMEVGELRTTEQINYPVKTLATTTSGLDTTTVNRCAAWDPYLNRICVGSDSTKINYSDDNGVTFTPATVTGGAGGAFFDIHFDEDTGVWIAGTSSGEIYTSTTGAVFTYQASIGSSPGLKFGLKPGSGYIVSRTDTEFATSADGVNWTTIPNTSGYLARGIVYAPEIDTWVVSVLDGILYSTDQVTWTKVTLNSGVAHNDVTWTGEYFVVVTGSTDVHRSTDGITWTTVQAPAGTAWAFIGYNRAGNALCATATTYFTGNRVMFSSDNGVTWQQLALTLSTQGVTETQTGFFIANATGTQRGYTVGINVPKITPGWPRVTGTAAEVMTELGDYTFVPPIDLIHEMQARVQIKHGVATGRVYVDEVNTTQGTAVTDVTWPASTTINAYSGDILQRLTTNGLAITDTRAGNNYYVKIEGDGNLGGGLGVENLPVTTRAVDTSRSWGRAWYDSETGTLAVLRGSNGTTTAMVSFSQDLGQTWTDATFTVQSTADAILVNIWKHGTQWVVVNNNLRLYKGTSLTSLTYGYYFPAAILGYVVYDNGTSYVPTTLGVAYATDISNSGNWTTHYTGAASMYSGTTSPYGIIFGGYNPSTGASTIARLSGGTWTNTTTGINSYCGAVGRIGSKVYAFGRSLSTQKSTPSAQSTSNGTTWTSASLTGLRTDRAVTSLQVNPVTGQGIMFQYYSAADDTDMTMRLSSDNGASWVVGTRPLSGNLIIPAGDQFIVTGSSSSPVQLLSSLPDAEFAVNGNETYYATGSSAVTASGATLAFDGNGHKINVEVGSSVSEKIFGQRTFNIYKA